MSDTVVVGYIRSPEGDAALAAAVDETRRRQGRLVIVHSSRGGDEDADKVLKDRRALERVGHDLLSSGLDVEIQDLARGNEVPEDLIEVARERDAAVLVIGMRRRSPVGKLLLGSNAQEILLDAPCPVLAVKAASE